jgi:5-methylcytosine-specific restriction endonuclease McrA
MAAIRGLKNKAGGTWTTARYWSFIRSCLRRAWSRYPVRYQVLKEAQKPYTGTDKRTKWLYECADCSQDFKTKEVEVDHIVGAGSLKDYSDLAGFCERLFCEKDNLRVLCKPCHKKRTDEERKK